MMKKKTLGLETQEGKDDLSAPTKFEVVSLPRYDPSYIMNNITNFHAIFRHDR